MGIKGSWEYSINHEVFEMMDYTYIYELNDDIGKWNKEIWHILTMTGGFPNVYSQNTGQIFINIGCIRFTLVRIMRNTENRGNFECMGMKSMESEKH